MNRIMIYGPKEDGTYDVVEFKTAAGEALAISRTGALIGSRRRPAHQSITASWPGSA
jgi:hypothetical protein